MAVPIRELSIPEPAPDLPPLRNGDHLDQPTFHARYQAMPEDVRAELIGGIVFMASPVGRRHGYSHPFAIHWLVEFHASAPGTEVLLDATVILPDTEVQPDACLRVLPSRGGRTTERDDTIYGAPELVLEVASSTESSDLHLKRESYERAGVDEYVVILLRQREVRWFSLVEGRYVRLEPGEDAILRSRRFPGLWLDPAALLAGDVRRTRAVVEAGVATAEHAAWLEALRRQAASAEGD